MATSAFKSTSRRAPFGGSDEVSAAASSSSSSSSANRAHRRSRSLSRFSRSLPFGEDPSYGVEATPRRKFVNTVRGSEFPEISLDDLAIELFSQRDEDPGSSDHDRSRSGSETASSQRRGRSVSRQSSKTSGDRKSVVSDRSRVNTGLPESNSRRRRSVSVARYQISDSESDADHSRKQANLITMKSLGNGKNDIPSHKATAANGSGQRRPLNQKDLLRLQDGYSSHSSVLTDDEIKDHPCKNGNEKTIKAVYSQKKVRTFCFF
nr:ATP-dependent RNA helicase [Ipomoea batatas]